MSKFYELYRGLYAALFTPRNDFAKALVPRDASKIAALTNTLAEAEKLRAGLRGAYDREDAAGRPTAPIYRELRRATFVTGAIRDLLIEAEDNSEQIVAALDAINAVNIDLEHIGKSAEELANHLGNATAAIDAIAKLLTLIG